MDDSKKQVGKVQRIHSVRFKVLLILIVAMISISTGVSAVFIISSKRHIGTLNQHYMYDLAKACATQVQSVMDEVGYDAAVDYDILEGMLKGVGLQGIDSSYTYLVAADGTMLYHPTKDKVGQKVENEVVNGLVEQLQSRVVPAGAVTTYDYRGVKKYAAYSIERVGSWILVITADEREILKPIQNIVVNGLLISLFLLIFFVTIDSFVISLIVKPIKKMTDVVARLAHMDFTKIEGQEKMVARKDEMGLMSRAVIGLREKLTDVISDLKDQSERLFIASDSLNTNASETASTVEQVEKAVADIAEGATSQANETQKATENVILMGNMVEETNLEVSSLLENATEMRKASAEANETLAELEKINVKAKEAIDEIYKQTNTTNESAKKIREATALITSIAEETNLLSLNASIEAARAGEQGRGFVVVASQIQKLAEQSNKSASQIESIIDSLIKDSDNAVATMVEVKEIIADQNENVEKTSQIFGEVEQRVTASIEGVNLIAEKTKMMDEARINVVDVVQSLTAIAEENAASTEETSASVTEVSSIVFDISENASSLKKVADKLEENMSIFKI